MPIIENHRNIINSQLQQQLQSSEHFHSITELKDSHKNSTSSNASLLSQSGILIDNKYLESGFNSLLREQQRGIPILATAETTGSSQDLEESQTDIIKITANNLIQEIFNSPTTKSKTGKILMIETEKRCLEPLKENTSDLSPSPNDKMRYSDMSACYHDEVALEDDDDVIEYRDEDVESSVIYQNNHDGYNHNSDTLSHLVTSNTMEQCSDTMTQELRTNTQYNDISENHAVSMVTTTDSVIEDNLSDSHTPTESVVKADSFDEEVDDVKAKTFQEICKDFESKDVSRSLQPYQNQVNLPSIKVLNEIVITNKETTNNSNNNNKTQGEISQPQSPSSGINNQTGNIFEKKTMSESDNTKNMNTNDDKNNGGPGCHKNSDPAGSAKTKQTFIMGQCSMYNLIVYPDRAHVYRKEKPCFNANEVTEILFDCVSPAIHKDSIRVELRGRATILDVSLNEYPINEAAMSAERGDFTSTSDQILEEIRQCRKEIEMISAKILRAEKQRELLHTYADKMTARTAGEEQDECFSQHETSTNKCTKGNDKHRDKQTKENHNQLVQMNAIDKGLLNPFDPQTMDTLNRFLSTYEEQIEKLDAQILDGQDDLARLDQRIEYLDSKLFEVQMKDDENFHRELSVIVEPRETGPVEIIVSYVVSKCGWVPSYDIRMFNSDGSMKIIYYGMVTQLTGEDWAKIPKMSLSTAQPGLGGTVPHLGLQKVQYKNGASQMTSGRTGLLTSPSSMSMKLGEIDITSATTTSNQCVGRACHQHGACGKLNKTIIGSATMSSSSLNYLSKSLHSNHQPATIHHCHPLSQQTRLRQGMRKGHSTTGRNTHFEDDEEIGRDNSHTNTLQRATSALDTNRTSKHLDHKHAFATSLLLNACPPGSHDTPNLHTTIKSVADYPGNSGSLPHVNFEVPRPLAMIRSDGRPHRATVGLIDVQSPQYDYVSVPKRSPYAFLKAKAINESPFYLLAGQTNIYSDNSFIGKIDFNNVAPGEEFTSQLGSEHGIKLAYKPMFKTKNTSSNKTTVTFKQSIDIKNTFDREIKLTVIDQLPISGEDKIKVHLIEPHIKNPEKYDPKKPIRMNKNNNIEWDIGLKPNEQKEILLKFSVEHPVNEELEVICSDPIA